MLPRSFAIFPPEFQEFIAQFVDLRFAEVDPLALLENVEKKNWQLATSIVGDDPVAAALAPARRRKPDFARTTRTDDHVARGRICSDVVDNEPPLACVPKIVRSLDDRVHHLGWWHCHPPASSSNRWHCHPLASDRRPGKPPWLHFFNGAEDPLEASIEILASPPGKKLQVMSLLSGGEQALTALALLFAVFLVNPAPICVLDEVDAPLDDANVERFCNLVGELGRAGDTRFLVIAHHRLTMARMDRLFGVTMSERGVSQLVSVDLQDAHELKAAQ